MKKILKIIGLILVILLLLVIAAYVALQTQGGKAWLATTISEQASDEHQRLTINQLSGHLPWNVAVQQIIIADANGTWLEVADAKLDWQPLALLFGAININSLTASHIHMHRTPAPAPEAHAAPSELFNLQSLSIPAIRLAQVNIPEVKLPAELTGGEATIWQVMLSSDDAKTNGFKGQIHTTQGPRTNIEFNASISNIIDIAAQISEQPGGVISSLAGLEQNMPLASDITISGTPEHFNAAAKLESGEVTLLEMTAKKAEQIHMKASGTIPPQFNEALTLPSTQWQLSANAQQNGDVWNISQALASLGNAKLEASGAFDVGSGALEDVMLSLAILDLQPWSDTANQPLSGNVAGDLKLSGSLNKAMFKLVSDSTINGLPFKLMTAGTASDFNQVDVSELNITIPQLVVSGTASYALDAKKVVADLDISKLYLAQVTQGALGGNVAGSISIDGTLDKLPIQIKAKADNLSKLPEPLAGWMSKAADINIDALYAPEQLTMNALNLRSGMLSANASGAVPLASSDQASSLKLALTHEKFDPINASLDILQRPTSIALSNIAVQTKGTKLGGAIDYGVDSGLAAGALKADSSDFSAIGKWLGFDAPSGSANALMTLGSGSNKQSVALDLSAARLQMPSASARLGTLKLNMQTSDVATLAALKLDATASNILVDDLQITSLNANVGSLSAINSASNFTLSLSGSQAAESIKLAANGSADLLGDERNVILKSLAGNYGKLPYKLTAPVTIQMADNNASLSALNLQVADGVVKARGSKAGNKIDVEASLSALPLKPLLSDVTPLAPESRADATLNISGSASQPLLNFDSIITIDAPTKKDKDTTVTLTTLWDNTAANALIRSSMNIDSDGNIGTASLDIPAGLSLAPFALNVQDASSLKGLVDMDIPLTRFNSWLAPLGHELAGIMQADVNIAGTVSQPITSGTLAWQEGVYEHLSFGACLRNIDMRAEFNPQSITINHLTATGDRSKGSVTGGGSINLAEGLVDTNIHMENLAAFCRGVAKGEVAGDIAVKGTFDDIAATGALALGPMTVQIPTGSQSEIPEVDTVYKRELQERAGAKEGVIRLGIDVALAEPIFVRGRGLDSQFEGALRLEGTASQPEIDGKLETKRGQLELLGSTLSISKGEIRFLDRSPVNPYVDMVATTRANDVDINVELSGAVSKPDLSFSSSPSRPQDELLALLLFGRPLAKITPFQALQLAQAAATLAGKTSGPGVLGLARDTLGIDTLNIGQDEDGGATVGAGKYVTDRVFVGVEQGTTPESRKVKTEIELTPNITAETATGATGGPSVGAEWRYDY